MKAAGLRRMRCGHALALTATLAFSGIAHAGDMANFSPIGFSSDGAFFAFEEHGVQDGSGFPYSSIFVIDVKNDRWVEGSPVHVMIKQEQVPPGKAREEALEKARPLIDKLGLNDDPGVLAVYSPPGDASQDPHKIRYYPYAAVPAFGTPYGIRLEEIDQPAPERCSGFMEKSYSFRLRLVESDGKETDRVLYEDAGLPRGRQCVTGYRLGGMMVQHAMNKTTSIALVMTLSLGFEGNHGRWIAVPVSP